MKIGNTEVGIDALTMIILGMLAILVVIGFIINMVMGC